MPAPRMIKSVVDEAGLGKFVYLQGISGRRYVFSSIRPEQAALYDHALFAVTDWGQGEQPGIRVDLGVLCGEFDGSGFRLCAEI